MERRSSRIAYETPWLRVREDGVVFPDGTPSIYSVLEKPDFALVVPLVDDGFWLVQQYRYAVGDRSWEFPQGGWPSGHSGTQLELAQAELREETGLTAASWTHLGRLHAAIGYSSQRYDAYLATDLTPGDTALEASEQDMVHRWFPRSEVVDMIRRGDFTDGHGVAALALLDLLV